MEGRHPADAGCWNITVLRLEVGEGLPRDDTPSAFATFPKRSPFPPTERPPYKALYWNDYYRRIRSALECDDVIRQNRQEDRQIIWHMEPRAAFHLTAAWANPRGGLIPSPCEADPVLPLTHAAAFIGRHPDRHMLRFRLKWPDWGEGGKGYMPYQYFDKYVFECWSFYTKARLKSYRIRNRDKRGRAYWTALDEKNRRIHAYEIRGWKDERHAWAFMLERNGALEIEELYVRPEFRGLGHGRWMAERIAKLALTMGLPLRLWVSFADCKSESESNYAALVATSLRLGLRFRQSGVAWAAYFATNEGVGEDYPVEPILVPARPRTPRQELLRYVALLGIGQGEMPVTEQSTPPAVIRPENAALASDVSNSFVFSEDIEVGSPAWNSMNQRRGELIDVKIRLGYSNMESSDRAEYDRLQYISEKAIERAFPSPLTDDPDIKRLYQLLAAQSGTDEK